MASNTVRTAHVAAALTAALLLVAPALALAQSANLGTWTNSRALPVSMSHALLLPNGKVMFWGEFDGGATPYVWNPDTSQLTKLAAPAYNLFGGGHVVLPDGRVFDAGGYVAPNLGVKNSSLFDPTALTWAAGPDMNAARYCPTAIGLANGDVLVLSGQESAAIAATPTAPAVPAVVNPLNQVFELSTSQWRSLTGVTAKLPIYSRAFVGPDGRVFVAGPVPKSVYLNPEGAGASVPGPITLLATERTYGSAVMYDVGKILLAGGGAVPTATAETIDLSSGAWTATSALSTPRRQQNATVLPDGSVLLVGGTQSGATFNDATGAVLEPERWDPATGAWSKLAPATSYRGYDSISLLLPDGRVLFGGGRGANGLSYQVYSPPYMSSAARPSIDDAPDQVWPGAQFFVQTPEGASIAKVALVRLGSVTHAWDMNQRYVPLSFTTEGANGHGLVVTGPEDNNVAPTGHYMLFLVDSNGVPSEAKIVSVVYGPSAGPAPAMNVPAADAQPPAPKSTGKSKGGCSAGGSDAAPVAGAFVLAAVLLIRRRRRTVQVCPVPVRARN